MITIDGSFGEGGGQIVRSALALSMLTGQEFEVKKIRAGRRKPGLKAQHLTALRALKEMSDAQSTEVSLGAESFWFKPAKIRPGTYTIDIGTAGSISLLLQALMLPCMFAEGPTTLHFSGGTDAKWAAPVLYIQHVLLPCLHPLCDIELVQEKPGYFPKGGGKVTVTFRPKFTDYKLLALEAPFDLREHGALISVKGIAHASLGLEKRNLAERISEAAIAHLKQNNVEAKIETKYADSRSDGAGITLWAEFERPEGAAYPRILGADALGQKGKPAEAVGEDAAARLLHEFAHPAPVDEFLADQLIPFVSLIPGSRLFVPEMVGHVISGIYVMETFLPVKLEENAHLIEVKANY